IWKHSKNKLVQKESFLTALQNRILLFDGAMGTEIQKYNPKPEDFPNNQDGFNDGLILTHPEWIKQIHQNYLNAGSDCIETNSFGSNKIKLDEYGFGNQTVDFNKKIAKLAVEACSVDALLIETSQDILEVKLAIEACHNAMKKTGKKIPIIANTTLDQYGKMLLGTNIQAAYTTVSDMGIDVFGLNCSTGPIEMTPSVRSLDEQNEHDLLVVPNAGMPENQGGQAVYKMTPEKMGEVLGDFLKQYKKVRIIGGCCGTNPQHIAILRKVIDEKAYSTKG